MRYVSAWDGVGAGLSGLCVVHCLVLPLFLAVAPGLSVLLDEAVHRTLLALLLVPSALAFLPAYRLHRRRLPWVLALAGITLLIAGAFGGWQTWEQPLTLAGSGALISAHVLNHTFCRLCRLVRHQHAVPVAKSVPGETAWSPCACQHESDGITGSSVRSDSPR